MLPSTNTFDIPELLEMILDHAAPEDLFLWQRVNKTWQAAIQGSPRLQEKLFFRVNTCKNTTEQKCVAWNPFLDLFTMETNGATYASRIFDRYVVEEMTRWLGPCKRMFVTSPSVTELEFEHHEMIFEMNCFERISKKSIRCETGITIGLLLRHMKEAESMNSILFQFTNPACTDGDLDESEDEDEW